MTMMTMMMTRRIRVSLLTLPRHTPDHPFVETGVTKKGDVLMFRKPFFMEDYDGAVVGGLEAPAMLRRDRTGVIFGRTRQRPRARQKGAFLYTVVFDDPSTKVPRLPAHGDDGIDDDENVEFLNDAAA